ncbi:MAG: hypothetical protein MJY84_01715 [Bacteroidales bacterium]|nr:hypothetical protein [Bacteroidales bacterium]
MKKNYQKLLISPVCFDMEGPVLEGSFTNKAIKVNTVSVDPFDPGFVDGSGNEIPFQDISFE